MTKNIKPPRAGIIYRGPSMIDGAPIVCVALYSTSNRKTGGMLQTYILNDNGMLPIEAIRSGADAAICGDCKHRGNGIDYGSRSCYVNVAQGPTVVAKGIVRGIYPDAFPTMSAIRALGAGRMVRMGTYGDPAAVPRSVWSWLILDAAGHTGYTHQWRRPEFASFASIVMASADSIEEATTARAAGWRTFRVRVTGYENIGKFEFACPASAEMRARTTCSACLACAGADGRKGNPVIIAHGALARRFAINQGNQNA